MPKQVDHEGRRREILLATLDVLSEQGPSGLSFRTVAKRMGGSSTLVTHYFPSRQALIDALVGDIASWPDQIGEIEAGATDARERLRRFLRWLLPDDAQGLKEESARINLIGERDIRLRTDHLFDAWDDKARELLRGHVEGLVRPDRVDTVVDVLRSTTNGITLSVIEHPTKWPPDRQHAVLDEILSAFGLLPEGEAEAPATTVEARS